MGISCKKDKRKETKTKKINKTNIPSERKVSLKPWKEGVVC